jgi:hypothetical protein
MRIDYDGRRFVSSAAETAGAGDFPVARYAQRGDLVWAEFAGGRVRAGRLVGVAAPNGVLRLAYCQVLTDGAMVAGECVSTPTVLPDGRLRLEERWRRADGSTGVSVIEELPAARAVGEVAG